MTNLFLQKNQSVLLAGPFVSLLMFLIYFNANRGVKNGYERMIASLGTARLEKSKYELFEDKIVSNYSTAKTEYLYSQVTGLFETKHFLILMLQHGLCHTLEKSTFENVDDVKAFLLKRCTVVKKRKFQSCKNDKKWALGLLIALIALSIIGTVLGFILILSSKFIG